MPFVRRLIFKGENKCETAQQHSNWSVSSDQYFHPPTVDREGKKKDKEQIHHYYISCVQIQKWDSRPLLGRLFSFSASLARWGPVRKHVLPPPAIDDLLYRLHFYAIIPELFITLASHWWTDAVPYQQHISYAYRTTPLISGSIPLMYYASGLTPHRRLTLLVYSIAVTFLQRHEHQTPISSLTPPLGASHICLSTPGALDTTRILDHTCSAGLGRGTAFVFVARVVFLHRHRWQRAAEKAHLCSPPRTCCAHYFDFFPPCHSAQVPPLTYHINF